MDRRSHRLVKLNASHLNLDEFSASREQRRSFRGWWFAALFTMWLGGAAGAAEITVNTTLALVSAVNSGSIGDTVTVASGTYELIAPLIPKAGMTIQGAGIDRTILTNASSWQPGTATLPEGGVSTSAIDKGAYLFSLTSNTHSITISNLTLKGPELHGALYGYNNDSLHLFNLKIDDFRWSGIRTFAMDGARIHDCEFVDAGGRWQNGAPGTSGGTTGGGIYVTYMKTSEIWNNRFGRTKSGSQFNYFGIKGREGRASRIHHNTINVNFAMEFPFENDQTMEIDHNVCKGVISIPKHAGGPVPTGGYTFHIHHNWFTTSYAIEFVRNGVEIDHNLFDFATNSDGGNLISAFGSAAAPGPATFHNNLIKNPGRGVYWVNEIFNNIVFRNNHVIANTTVTPRTDGLFGFNSGCDFNTITIKDNIIECIGLTRPLVRNTNSNSAVIENNTLTNVSGTGNYANPDTGAVRGLTAPLLFPCGVNGEYVVDGWNVSGGPPPPTYAAWSAAINWESVPADQRNPGDNPDGDLSNNFLERALGGDPTHAEAGQGTWQEREPQTGGATLITQWYRKAAPDLTYQFKWSTDLATWCATGVITGQLDPASNLYFQRYLLPAGTSRWFGRLEISGP